MVRRVQPLVFALLVLMPSSVRSDDWPGAQSQTVFSADGRRFVRLLPGTAWGDTIGFAGARKGPYARGQFYALQSDRSYRLVADVALLNPVAPVDAILTNRGELVTFDNWHNFGFGAVVAIYDPTGAVRASYTLEQLYDAAKLSAVPRSTSSRWWRCRPFGFVDPGSETSLYVREHLGGEFVFSLTAPSFEYRAGQAPCQPPAGPFSASGGR
jgi:hypothetical protein